MRGVKQLVPILLAASAVLLCSSLSDSTSMEFDPMGEAFPPWERLNGPPGGYIECIEQCASRPEVLYAAGGGEGLYKTTDAGVSWELLPGGDRGHSAMLWVNPEDPEHLYGWGDGLSESRDGGWSWRAIGRGFEETMWPQQLVVDEVSGALYVAGQRHGGGTTLFTSKDNGGSWREIGPKGIPGQTSVGGLAVQAGGALYLGINNQGAGDSGSGWTSRFYVSDDDGASWAGIEYGSIERRYIWSVFSDPWQSGVVWLSEGPLHNERIDQPMLFRSVDYGRSWNPVDIRADGWDSTQVRVIGASSRGEIYVAAGSNLLVTDREGRVFRNITPPRDRMNGVDFFDIEVHAENPDTLYLPLRAGGIAYSEDAGLTWSRKDNGIATISANLIEADPFRPATVYVSSLQGQGVFRSDDYGETWSGSLDGIQHPWGDEIVADPHNENVVWFIGDVPVVHRSVDSGDTWTVEIHPDEPGAFNFGSVYAFSQGQSPDTIYVVDNGFGIFRGEGGRWSGQWDWRFLRTSEIDYTYTLEVDPSDDQVLYSGYSRKPFQDSAMIRQSLDGGDSWGTTLLLEGAEAVTSIAIATGDAHQVYAAATGEQGSIWHTGDRGKTWTQPNTWFNFTTIHSSAVSPSDPAIAYAGIWGGGTFRTADGGRSWVELEAEEAFSAAGIAVDPRDSDVVYIADRTSPHLFRSRDKGQHFEPVFDAGSGYSRLMGVAIDPSNPECLYTIAMLAPTAMDREPGAHGALLRIENGAWLDITGTLPRMPLAITVHPEDSERLYAVLHGYGVYASQDRGATWEDIGGQGSGLPQSGFFNLIVDPWSPETLYLVGGCDVRFGSFSSAGLDPDVVNGVYRSTDGGGSWESINGTVLGAESGPIKAIAFDAESPQIIYAAAENGLYISTDRGGTWTRDAGIPYSTLGGVACVGDGILAMTNGAGVLHGVLDDGGAIAWQSEPALAARVYFAQVLVDVTDTKTVYASAYPGGVFKSSDGGSSWHEANFGMTSFAVEDPLRQGYYALSLAPSEPSTLYLGLYGKGIYKSYDAAGTWMPMNGASGEMLGQFVTALTVDPANFERVFVGSEDGVFRTLDGGVTWESANHGLPTTDVKSIEFSVSGDLYAGTRGYGLYRWSESSGRWNAQRPVGQWGVIWPMWNDRPRYQYSDMLFHALDPNRVLFGTFPAGIYSSDDAGHTWRERNVGWTLDGVFSLVSHPEDPELVYAGTYNGVNRSLDFGQHWELWDEGWPEEQWVFRIVFDPRDSDVMYACSKNGENEGTGRSGFHGTVMKSTNGGSTWFQITTGLSLDQEFYDIVVDPVNPDVLYLAAQHEGMFISADAGASWTAWNQGLHGKVPATNGNNVTRVLALSGDGRYLYFGVSGAGVYRREIHPLSHPALPVADG